MPELHLLSLVRYSELRRKLRLRSIGMWQASAEPIATLKSFEQI